MPTDLPSPAPTPVAPLGPGVRSQESVVTANSRLPTPDSRPSGMAPPPDAPRKDEATRKAELKRMKRVASGLLVVALGVFLIALMLEPAYPWMGFVRATAEA